MVASDPSKYDFLIAYSISYVSALITVSHSKYTDVSEFALQVVIAVGADGIVVSLLVYSDQSL